MHTDAHDAPEVLVCIFAVGMSIPGQTYREFVVSF